MTDEERALDAEIRLAGSDIIPPALWAKLACELHPTQWRIQRAVREGTTVTLHLLNSRSYAQKRQVWWCGAMFPVERWVLQEEHIEP